MPTNHFQNILVTGGAGYIGSHTCKALARAGFEPVVLDNLSTGHKEFVKWGPLVEGNVGDKTLVESVLQKYRIGSVIHFAANAYVGESMVNPAKYFENNVINSLNFLEVLVKTGGIPVVFSSSCATYGLPENLPITENDPQNPINPYGESKLFIEKALHWYGELHGFRSIVLRYFNAAGADPEGEVGESHEPETHLIPNILKAAMTGEQVTIFGSDFPTQDGTAVRDYIHVCDLAEAHVLAVELLVKNGGSNTFNLGIGSGYSNRQILETVEKITAQKIGVAFAGRRPGDPPQLIASWKRAKNLLGWQPRYSDIGTIVQTAWDWHQINIPDR